MAPSNSFAKILYTGISNCPILNPNSLPENCFNSYKNSLALSLIPGVIIYFALGFIIGLIIEKIISEIKRPKSLLQEIEPHFFKTSV